MKRLLMMVPVVALASGALAPSVQADPDVPGSGAACGSSATIDPAVAGVATSGDEDWYDVSFSSGSRDLKVTSHSEVPSDPTNVFSWLGSSLTVELYDWDPATNTCTRIFQNACGVGRCNPVSLVGGGWDGVVSPPGPGDYQLRIASTTPGSNHPVAYAVNVQQ